MHEVIPEQHEVIPDRFYQVINQAISKLGQSRHYVPAFKVISLLYALVNEGSARTPSHRNDLHGNS